MDAHRCCGAPIRIPASLGSALALAAAFTVLFGVSNVATRFGDLAVFGLLP